MKEISEEERLANQRIELVNDLIACETVMDEIWKFHPDNPKKKDVVREYEILQQVSENLKEELENLS
jgi:hypothetical protein